MRLYDILQMPPKIIFKKGIKKISLELKFLCNRLNDQFQSTYILNLPASLKQPASFLGRFNIKDSTLRSNELFSVADYYIRHYFDLLGSGWVQIKHGMNCRGLEGLVYRMGKPIQSDPEGQWLEGRVNPSNLPESKRIWQLVDKDYTPLDWHLDFKSGYRWPENRYYLNIWYGHKPGVDIKVPWELSRMQHLPQLAIAYAVSAGSIKSGINPSDIIIKEFRNQVLDFIATNPPRFGVNWRCTMDVGIRISNWLVAYDIFKANGVKFDPGFEQVFIRSIYEHGRHIINNLEWSAELRSNHYLANIVGLLFVAAYLPGLPETDSWLLFALKELISEVKSQFYEDGGNFEASTCYHRLSAEMVVYATALILGLSEERLNSLVNADSVANIRIGLSSEPVVFYPLAGSNRFIPFPPWYIQRLEKMAEFTMQTTKPDGHVPQVGDNDSGRFLKLQPAYKEMTVAEAKFFYDNLQGYQDLPDNATFWDEDFLDHRHLVAAINALFGREDFSAFTGVGWLEKELIQCLAKSIDLSSHLRTVPSSEAGVLSAGGIDWSRLMNELDVIPAVEQHIIEILLPDEELYEGIKFNGYPEFGLYIYKSQRLYLAIRCGPIGQNGNGGHAHNDQLSIELSIDGIDWIIDPGTYLYTPLPERRNEYRSVEAHFSPHLKGIEPATLGLYLFKLGNQASAECLHFSAKGFVGRVNTPLYNVCRFISFKNNKIEIVDYIYGFSNSSQTRILKQMSSPYHSPLSFSPGYGKKRFPKSFE